MEYTAKATLDMPIDRAWAVLSDHSALERWGPCIRVSLQPAAGDQPSGVGAVRTIKAAGPPIVEEITAFEPNRKLGYKALSGAPLKDYTGEVVLTADGDKTKVSYTVAASQRVPVLDGLLVRLIATLLLNGFKRGCAAS